MKIPNSIRISGIEYEVLSVPDLNDGNKVLAGQISYNKSQISLNTLNPQYLGVTLWHEVIHAITTHANIELGDDEERIVDVVAYGIYQVLQDNGARLFDLKEDANV